MYKWLSLSEVCDRLERHIPANPSEASGYHLAYLSTLCQLAEFLEMASLPSDALRQRLARLKMRVEEL